MIHNRPLTVYTTNTRRANVYQSAPQDIGQFFERLRSSQAIPFSHDSYMALSKGQQDDLKDVGGFVLGELRGGRRKAGAVLSRCAAVLDADTLGPGETDGVVRRMEALGCCYCIYSTAKHSPDAPRLRIVIPFSEDITADEYEPVTRLLCQMIQPEMTWFDPSTAEPSRMMYYPAHCQDIAPVYYAGDKPLLDARVLLSRLQDWQDVTSWPRFPQEQTPARLAAKQGDPETKHGVVGAFCRVYDVPAAMDKFLPGVYEETDTPGRYTFTGGSTTGGAVLYDGGKFLYSHHATDPCGGKLVNAFDLVRLHRFEGLDDEAKPGTLPHQLPSYKAMCELAVADEAVVGLLSDERWEKAQEAFGPVSEPDKEDDGSWRRPPIMDVDTQGNPIKSMKNLRTALERNPKLKGRLRLNLFSGRIDVDGVLPWVRPGIAKTWSDDDAAQLRIYLEPFFGKIAKNDILDAVAACASDQAYHPVRDYLNGLTWDGVPRLDTLLIDYLGAEDTPYTRAVTRKSFVAAVARIMTPGRKYDTMLVLVGEQGRYKSTVFMIMGGDWFSDSLRTFGDKDSMETIQGTWINEVAEMQALAKAEINAVKMFLSKRSDYYRAAYGRYAIDRPRQCVFFGTSNTKECLTDTTGNRRFWPVDIDQQPRKKDVGSELAKERDQLWAEAMAYWKLGEALYLPQDLEKEARTVQEAHREQHPWEGIIVDFLREELPADWPKWDLPQRQSWRGGGVKYDGPLAPRSRVCAIEIWCEALGKQRGDMRQRESREINGLLARAPGWTHIGVAKAGKPYGNQGCYERK